jgi:hypothetical protein
MHEAQERRLGKPSRNKFAHFIKALITLLVSGWLLYVFDVVGVMWKSKKLYHSFLYLSVLCFAIFVAIGLYVTFVLSRSNPTWENTHMHLIYYATGSAVIGSVTWTIAVWPVFHFWTFPLGIAGLFFCVSFIDFMPGVKRKDD